MSTDFIKIAANFWVAPQIAPGDAARAAAFGVRTLINNRPDGEAPGQPAGAEIAAAAERAGLSYVHIPVGPAGIGERELDRFDAATAGATPVLAFCRSGARATVLRALSLARAGADPDALVNEAAAAGFDLSGVGPRLKALSAAAKQKRAL
jgi:uncharacterized protein (TIGR01244 family)